VFEVIGWSAAILTQVFWIPNIARIVRTKDVQGYSVFAWVVMTTGIALFLVYFLSRGDAVAIATNASGTAGAAITLLCVLRWRRKRGDLSPARDVRPGEPLPIAADRAAE
jgi:MtN3 and saliva related transmembrane protein